MKKTKFCNKCKTERLKEEFSKCKSKKGGLASACKHCAKQYRIDNKEILSEKAKIRMKKYRKENPEKVKASSSAYYKSKKGKEASKRYWQSKKGKENKRKALKKFRQTKKGKELSKKGVKLYNKRHRQKYLAHKKLQYAVKSGKLTRPKFCPKCGKTNCQIDSHHSDYSKPLDVIWLCQSCHTALHLELKK